MASVSALRQDKRRAGIAFGTEGPKQIGIFITLILGLSWSGPLYSPLVDQFVLLADPHFILKPQLNRGLRRDLL